MAAFVRLATVPSRTSVWLHIKNGPTQHTQGTTQSHDSVTHGGRRPASLTICGMRLCPDVLALVLLQSILLKTRLWDEGDCSTIQQQNLVNSRKHKHRTLMICCSNNLRQYVLMWTFSSSWCGFRNWLSGLSGASFVRRIAQQVQVATELVNALWNACP